MPEVLIRCPVTGKQVSTGISISPEAFAKASFPRQLAGCPHCGQRHVWSKETAYLMR